MKFNLNPLIFGEVHIDEVTRQWLVDNLETLNKQYHYQCFAFEYDKDVGLDDLIKNFEEQLIIIKAQYKNPTFVEKTIDEIKRNEMLKLLGNLGPYLSPALTTGQLVLIVEKLRPELNIRAQIVIHETAFREKINEALKHEKPISLLLELLNKVKNLGMSYVGLDENLEKQRSSGNIFSYAELDSKAAAERDPTITKRLAISAKKYNGGIISLIGPRHLPGIVRELPKVFAESPMLKSHLEALSQFKAIRLMNTSYRYNSAIEADLTQQCTQLEQEFNWFKLMKIDAQHADTNFLTSLVTTTEEAKTNVRVNSMN